MSKHLLAVPNGSQVLVDANVLLLLVVGLLNPAAIANHKRLSGYTIADFRVLRRFLSSYPTITTTAHVLAEVSNLAGAAPENFRIAIMHQLASLVVTMTEETLPVSTFCHRREFTIFGITDCALANLSRHMVLVTEDGRLAAHLRRSGSICFNLANLHTLVNGA